LTARPSRTLYYFAYGSNLHPIRLERRVDAIEALGVAQLRDHELAFNKRGADGSGKGNIMGARGAVVWGAVYALSETQAATLDGIEGSAYERVTLEVIRSDMGTALPVFSYRALAAAIDNSLTPFDWYLGFVVHGALHHGLPTTYVDRLRRVAAVRDANDERAHREQGVLEVIGLNDAPQSG
jgi:hypothetical protein